MTRLAKLFLGTAVAVTAVTCASIQSASAKSVGGAVAASQSRDLGTLTYADYSDATDWDPSIAFSTEVIFLPNVYEPLVWYRNGKVVPAIATSWKKSRDAKTWTFKIRRGVKFHDGTTVNAAAVKYSVERTMKLGKGAAYVWNAVKKIEVVNPYTVRFRLKYPAAIDLIAAGQYAAYVMSPKSAAKGTAWFQQGNDAGSGPYKVERWDKSEQIVLTKFDDYWKGWKRDHFGRVVIRIVTESSTRVQMLRRGDAHFAAVIPVEAIPSLRRDKNVEVLSFPGWLNRMWLLNTKKGPTADIRVRRAMSYAFDYKTVAKQFFPGATTVAKGPVPVAMWGASQRTPYRFDLNKARELLSQAGYGPDNRVKITGRYIAGIGTMQNEMLLFQRNLKQIGIDLQLEPGPWPTIWAKAKNLDTAPHVQSMTWWPTYATPNDWLIGLFKSESPTVFNLSHYSNPKYDTVLDRAVKFEASNRAKAITLYRQAQQTLLSDAAAIFSVDVSRGVFKRRSITGFQFYPAYETVFFYPLSER